MAVSNRVLGTLAAMAVVLSAWSVFGGNVGSRRARRLLAADRTAQRELRDSIRHLGWQVRTGALRDRVDSAFATYPVGAAPAVLILGEGASAAVEVAESLFSTLTEPALQGAPVRLAVIQWPNDSSLPTGTLSSFALFSRRDAEEVCTTVHIVSPGDSALNRYEQFTWRQAPWLGAVGPCWFQSRFGAPGPKVRAWLDARLWDVAASVPPNYQPLISLPDAVEAPGWQYRLLGQMRGSFYGESMMLEACVFDRPQLCEAVFLEAPAEASNWLPSGVVGNEWVMRRGIEGQFDLPSMAVQGLLAMMLEDLGAARFAEFWTSTRPVPEAFQAVAGMSLGAWFQGQLRRQIRDAGLPEPRRTPYWPSALGILGIALGGVLWFGGRRQVR